MRHELHNVARELDFDLSENNYSTQQLQIMRIFFFFQRKQLFFRPLIIRYI